MSQNRIIGTEKNDILLDTFLDDEIIALNGNDEIKISSGINFVDGGEGNDQLVVDYSTRREDLMLILNNYGDSGSIDVKSYSSNYNSYTDFYSIESFVINSGRGHDNIELGYDNYSDDEVNAGAGDDFIYAGLGNDTIDGGAGLDLLRLDFASSPMGVTSSLSDSNSGEYSDGINAIEFSNIEAVDVTGSNYSDVLVAVAGRSGSDIYPMNSMVNGGEGSDQLVVDYSGSREDQMLMLNGYGESGSIDINSYMSGNNSRIDFNSIESFVINSGRGHDSIDLGYDNYSDDEVNAGAGDDFINAGLGNDTIDGGAGLDLLRLDFASSPMGVTSSLSDSNSGEYSDGFNAIEFSNIEAVDVTGSNYSDVLVAVAGRSGSDIYPMNSMVNGGEGSDQLVVDYSGSREDQMLMLNGYGESGSIDINSYMSGNNSRIDFNSIESFVINSGRGHDSIDLGYDNYSDDEVDAGAGDDFINAGLGNDTIDGGAGLDLLRLDFASSPMGVTSSLSDSNSGEYSDGFNAIEFSNIEAVDVTGSNYSDVLVAVAGRSGSDIYPMNSMVNGGEGSDQLVVDYSGSREDLMLMLNNYGESGSIDINSYMSGNNSRIDFNSIESFVINSGRGHDNIDLGYDNYSDDEVDAGAGDDFINAGLGNDTIDGGLGNDTFVYELGSGVDIISDFNGDNDTIIFGSAINLDNLSLDFNNNDLTFSFKDSPEDLLVINDYLNSADSIENIEVAGQIFSIEEISELTTVPKTIGEFGKIDNFDHNSQTIQLENNYENPVVFALPLSRNDSDPAIVRITDLQNDRFTAYLQEVEYEDGKHSQESFSYMVLEAGTWELDNGSLLEVGMVNTNLVSTKGWENIAFDADFADVPVVLSQVQTNVESDFVRTRQKPASVDGFSLSMEEEQALMASGHANETIGWLAIDAGQGTLGQLEYQAGNTAREVTHRRYDLNFSQDFASEPLLFASLSSFYGSDPSGLRYQDLNADGVQIMVEEDLSLDSEVGHTSEIVDFLAISGDGDLTAIAYEPVDTI